MSKSELCLSGLLFWFLYEESETYAIKFPHFIHCQKLHHHERLWCHWNQSQHIVNLSSQIQLVHYHRQSYYFPGSIVWNRIEFACWLRIRMLPECEQIKFCELHAGGVSLAHSLKSLIGRRSSTPGGVSLLVLLSRVTQQLKLRAPAAAARAVRWTPRAISPFKGNWNRCRPRET